jgi:hypothetical protein
MFDEAEEERSAGLVGMFLAAVGLPVAASEHETTSRTRVAAPTYRVMDVIEVGMLVVRLPG